MSKNSIFAGIVIILITAVFLNTRSNPTPEVTSSTAGVIEVPAITGELMVDSLANADQITGRITGEIKGVIVPHDLTAGYLTAGAIKFLSNNPPSNIIVIGPNHFRSGDKFFTTTNHDWKIEDTIIKTNSSINTIIDSELIENNPEAIKHDHSITVPLAFIAKYLPNTTVIPLMIKPDAPLSEVLAVSQLLFKAIEQQSTLVIASVDFSHYLNTLQAMKKDKETLQAISKSDYQWLINRDSDHLDSSESVIMILELMKLNNTPTQTIIAHTNSGEIQNNPLVETTSHIVMTFH